MRQGELLGLQWSDIDFDKGTVAVQRVAHVLPTDDAALAQGLERLFG
jgi:integrase